MKIYTEAHGASPGIYEFETTIPRIAFFNQNNPNKFIETQIYHDNVLVVGADDIDQESIGYFMWKFLQLPKPFCSWAKTWGFNRSKSTGSSYANMNFNDAIAILNFFQEKRSLGHSELIVSCEFGHGRSVATAACLLAILEGTAIESTATPNKWVQHLLRKADGSMWPTLY